MDVVTKKKRKKSAQELAQGTVDKVFELVLNKGIPMDGGLTYFVNNRNVIDIANRLGYFKPFKLKPRNRRFK